MDTSAGATLSNPILVDFENEHLPSPAHGHATGGQSSMATEDLPKKPKPRTVEAIFTDFSGRRKALIRALTTDQDEFFGLCDPDKDALTLYGHETGIWEVTPPAQMLPPELPEPALGINYSRDKMERLDWLTIVAIHADSWLIGVAFYFGQVFLGELERMSLFSMMNDLPTVLESLLDFRKDESTCLPKEMASASSDNPKKRAGTTQDEDLNINPSNCSQGTTAAEDTDEDNEDSDQAYCAACGARYHANGFWICCDICDRWFHGKCVKVTSAQAEQVKEYKCPDCILEELGE